MYRVQRSNGSTFRILFPSYDAARAFARKRIRKTLNHGQRVATATATGDMWDKTSRNPVSIKRYGYRIVPVKASLVSSSLA